VPSGLDATLVALTWAYLGGLSAWLAGRLVLGDRLRALFYINSLAHLLFLPAPVTPAVGVLTGNVLLLAGSLFACLGFVYLWVAPLVRPRMRPGAPSPGSKLRVATYNLLWRNEDSAAILAAIRALDADVLALQEITPERAAELEPELAGEYPYRLLYPRPKAYGTGLLSRLPLTPSQDGISDPDWIGDPVIATLWFEGREIAAICVHAAAVRLPAANRERQARALVSYASSFDRPILIMGDFNTAPLNVAYPILRRGLQDAWAEAGHGFGHTFPGPGWVNASGDGLPRPVRRFVPHYLLRIDHILYSRHLRAVAYGTGAFSGGSDHRPVFTEIVLRDQSQ
jgi:endonuclease/exonuclease/phosphatase (EEP) superfamily protein YafD